jgi:hypothetical protein
MGIIIDFNEAKRKLAEKKKQRNYILEVAANRDNEISDTMFQTILQNIFLDRVDEGEEK